MAAYAALTSLMNIVDAIENHDSPPISLDKQQVESLTEIVTSLQEFLEVYNSPFADDEEADPLEMRIADAAYAAEDVIETHIVDTIEKKSSTHEEISCNSSIIWFFSCFRAFEENHEDGCMNRSKFHRDLQQVIEQMDQVKTVAMETDTDTNQQRRNEVSSFDTSTSSSITMVYCGDVLIGIMEKLTGDQIDRQVIPVVGMGGVGKTTLARNIYAHSLIKKHFDICAWVTITQQYDTRELLRELLSQATNTNKKELSDRSEDKLGLELRRYLYGRRFLIVMDDMWSIDAWDKVQFYLPSNENGSRILVTTRLWQLSSQLNDSCSFPMEFLDEVSSWDLFSKTVFGEKSCPPELEKIGKKIVESCKGLPLSIVVVGGLLGKMDCTPNCWESISNNFASTVNLENDKHCLRLLKMSYNHLPTYLKPCFLYMAVFEEDDRIEVSTLIKLWVSEGILKAKNDESLKTTAIGFLKDLVDRNLILVDTLGSTGNIKYCKVHDLLRDLCLNEAQKKGFCHIIDVGSRRGISSQRRIVIRKNTSKDKVLDDLNSVPNARSIICEYENFPSCRNLKLLRTLHTYKKFDYYEYQSYMNILLSQNVNLRHIAISGHIESSLDLFWNLQTLVASCSYSNAHVEIWKLAQLRHMKSHTGTWYLPDFWSDIDDMVIMKNLETLKGVIDFKCGEEMVKRIPNIKKLKIHYYHHHQPPEGDDQYCFTNIELFSELESLQVHNNLGYVEDLSMQKLTFPHSLKSLTLSMTSYVEWEEMLEKIGWLPLLQMLRLQTGCFGTGKWEIVEGQFPYLKFLELYECVGLKEWMVDESAALPRLEQLRLIRLEELEEIPREIGDIPMLQKILLDYCSDSAVESAKEIVDEQVEMQGEELSFDVVVKLWSKNEALESLASPNFIVQAPTYELVYII